ncbi:hypothetical protein [Aquimarina algiphila]|uniref:hypothetical protein n=1 Tax=Aquimarina algiphila TaxID=2047982 RepID=UPI0024915EE3|nr:hypothetical protein [Aquimarina algiphila]
MNNDNSSAIKDTSLKGVSAIPQLFSYVNDSMSIFVNGTPPTPDSTIAGSMVSDTNKPGSIAFVATPNTQSSTQTMITNIVSNNSAPSNRAFNFMLPPKALQESRPGQICLQVLPITTSLSNADSPLLHNGKGSGNLIPIIVGPSSVSLAQPLTTEEMKLAGFKEDLGVDWGGLLNGVTKAIPVIADTGLKIYNELSSSSQSDTKSGVKVEGIFSSIGSVIDTAIPFAAALL